MRSPVRPLELRCVHRIQPVSFVAEASRKLTGRHGRPAPHRANSRSSIWLRPRRGVRGTGDLGVVHVQLGDHNPQSEGSHLIEKSIQGRHHLPAGKHPGATRCRPPEWALRAARTVAADASYPVAPFRGRGFPAQHSRYSTPGAPSDQQQLQHEKQCRYTPAPAGSAIFPDKGHHLVCSTEQQVHSQHPRNRPSLGISPSLS